ncbi:hypothetical protein O0L34_g18181 [Tuta absoluta]|nr:hypothetical protein O0L34_g18181 [Tuta absoluta]
MIFNHNVEIFNTLLYEDTLKNNYAYFFDSNADLTFEMFSKYTGKFMNTGYKKLFANLRIIIQDIGLFHDGEHQGINHTDENIKHAELPDLSDKTKTEEKPVVNQFFLL